jgi:hypothetical protein
VRETKTGTHVARWIVSLANKSCHWQVGEAKAEKRPTCAGERARLPSAREWESGVCVISESNNARHNGHIFPWKSPLLSLSWVSCSSRRRAFILLSRQTRAIFHSAARQAESFSRARASPDFIKKILSKDYNIFLSSSIRRVRATTARTSISSSSP